MVTREYLNDNVTQPNKSVYFPKNIFLSIKAKFNEYKENLITNTTCIQFDEEAVKTVLENPLPAQTQLLNPKQKYFLQQTLETKDRTKIPLSDSECIYKGGWYHQGDMPTCVPWAIANGINRLGVSPDPCFVRDLLNSAFKGEQGMKFKDALQIAQRYPQSGVSLLEMSMEERIRVISKYFLRLTTNNNDLATIVKIESSSGKEIELTPDLVGALSWTMGSVAIKRNAISIQSILRGGGVILIGVLPEKPIPQKHACAIVGYKIKDGFMDVQYINPARGLLWTSLEYLSSTVITDPSYKLLRMNNTQ